jgi:chromate transport protein ChrA
LRPGWNRGGERFAIFRFPPLERLFWSREKTTIYSGRESVSPKYDAIVVVSFGQDDVTDTKAEAFQGNGDAPSLFHLFASFMRLGMTAFGGPAMVGRVGEMAAKRKRRPDRESLRHAAALRRMIPGATAVQMTAYIGLKVRGLRGATASCVDSGLPVFLFMLALSIGYVHGRSLPVVVSMFSGLHSVIVAVVADGAVSFAGSSIENRKAALIALIRKYGFRGEANLTGVRGRRPARRPLVSTFDFFPTKNRKRSTDSEKRLPFQTAQWETQHCASVVLCP